MHSRYFRPRTKGFTLVELIIVIVIIAILAVTAGPVVFGRFGIDEVAYRDRLVNLLRLQQQRAMQDTVNNYCILFEDNRFGRPVNCGDATLPTTFANEYDGLASSEANSKVTITTTPNLGTIYFNGLGCAGTSVNPQCGTFQLEVSVSDVLTQQLCVYSQGYITAGACTP